MGGGGPGRRGARKGSRGAGVTLRPAPAPPESRGPQPGAPLARPRAESRRPAAARGITPLAAARLVPGRSPDAHWPGRRSQAVSPCGVSARGRQRLNSAGAGLEGARETEAARPPLRRALYPRSPSAAHATARARARAQTRYERPGRAGVGSWLPGAGVLGPGRGRGGGGAVRLEGAPPARIFRPWARVVRRASGEG